MSLRMEVFPADLDATVEFHPECWLSAGARPAAEEEDQYGHLCAGQDYAEVTSITAGPLEAKVLRIQPR